MKISYDKSLKLLGVGVSPFLRLGPQTWFEDYKIASYYGWDLEKSFAEIFDLQSMNVNLNRVNTQSMLKDSKFQEVLLENFSTQKIITYKPSALSIPPALRQIEDNFLGSQYKGEYYENKVTFRKEFGGKLPFPKFKVLNLSELESLGHLPKNRAPFVLQHESMSGGKGTFIVRNQKDLEQAIMVYKNHGYNPKIVISQFIDDAAERSVQCCVTKYGTFVGPLQKQIIAAEELTNPGIVGSEKFSGAQINNEPSWESTHLQMCDVAKIVGDKLAKNGYKGIFGLDFLVDKNGKLYLLEINQRLTGITPLLTMLYREGKDIPFLLLHILELSKIDYEITDMNVKSTPPQGSMLIFHGKNQKPVKIVESLQSGIYKLKAGKLRFERNAIKLDDDPESILVQRYLQNGDTIKPGAKFAVAFSRNMVLDEKNNLSPAKEIIGEVYRLTKTD